MTGASSLPSPGDPPAPASRPASAASRRVTSPTTMHDRPDDARHEGEPHADRPEMRVDHQQAGPVAVTFTRFGYWAL